MAAAFQVVVNSWADAVSLVGGQCGGGWCQWWVNFLFAILLLYTLLLICGGQGDCLMYHH